MLLDGGSSSLLTSPILASVLSSDTDSYSDELLSTGMVMTDVTKLKSPTNTEAVGVIDGASSASAVSSSAMLVMDPTVETSLATDPINADVDTVGMTVVDSEPVVTGVTEDTDTVDDGVGLSSAKLCVSIPATDPVSVDDTVRSVTPSSVRAVVDVIDDAAFSPVVATP